MNVYATCTTHADRRPVATVARVLSLRAVRTPWTGAGFDADIALVTPVLSGPTTAAMTFEVAGTVAWSPPS